MVASTPKQLFLKSLDRCAADDRFIPSFYDRFLSTSNEVRNKFAETDFDKQNQMLLQSLRISAGATAGDPAALREIRERAETHSRDNLDIPPRLYDLWLKSVLETAREFDASWSHSVEEAWTTILGHVIKHMVKFY